MTLTLYAFNCGWFQCRLATDPDPYDEPRGVSGYVHAYLGEPTLADAILEGRQQCDESTLRAPLPVITSTRRSDPRARSRSGSRCRMSSRTLAIVWP